MLEVTNVQKLFSSGDGAVAAVAGVSLKIPQGQFASIVGQSGSGKTTLLGLLGALDKPTSGSIVVDGQDITKLRDHELIKGSRKDRKQRAQALLDQVGLSGVNQILPNYQSMTSNQKRIRKYPP